MEKNDKGLVASRFEKSRERYSDAARVQRDMGGELLRLVSFCAGREYGTILEVGCGGGEFTRRMLEAFDFKRLVLNDITSPPPDLPAAFEFLRGDAENIPLPTGCDLIVSNAVLQWLDDFDAFAVKAAGALKTGGIFAFSFFGEENFRELRALGAPSLTYPGRENVLKSLSEDFEVLAFSEYLHVLYFPDAMSVLRHLKDTGVTASGAGAYRSRGKLEQLLSAYEERFSVEKGEGRGVPLTYHPRLIVAQRHS